MKRMSGSGLLLVLALTAPAAANEKEHPKNLGTVPLAPVPQPVPGPTLRLDGEPRVLPVMTLGALAGTAFPRTFNFVDESEGADLVLFLKNSGATIARNVNATLSASGVPGLTVVTPTRRYGQIAAGVSVPAVFRIQTNGAPVGVHALTLSITHSAGSATETVNLPIWDVAISSYNVATGVVVGTLTTPFSTEQITVVAPEVYNAQGEPSYFDLQSIAVQRTLHSPYNGVHWGDAVENGLVQTSLTGHGAVKAGDTINVHGSVKTKSGTPIPGVTVKLTGTNGSMSMVTNEDGQFWFEGKPAGTYTRHVDPPPILRNIYSASWSQPTNMTGGNWTSEWTYPDPPPSGGGGGGNGGGSGKKTVVVGGLVGVGTVLLNAAAAPETFGAALLSLGGAVGIGAGSGYAADPDDMDLFYAGQEHTAQASPKEETQQETIAVDVKIVSPPLAGQPFAVDTQFTYDRQTDNGNHTWTGGESLSKPLYLVLQNTTAQVAGTTGVTVRTTVKLADGTLLKGGDPTVVAYVGVFDSMTGLRGTVVLHDDGLAPDTAANDGTFAGNAALGTVTLPLQVSIQALRTGFDDDRLPALYGSAVVNVTP